MVILLSILKPFLLGIILLPFIVPLLQKKFLHVILTTRILTNNGLSPSFLFYTIISRKMVRTFIISKFIISFPILLPSFLKKLLLAIYAWFFLICPSLISWTSSSKTNLQNWSKVCWGVLGFSWRTLFLDSLNTLYGWGSLLSTIAIN